jgi:N-methylhydantoinase A
MAGAGMRAPLHVMHSAGGTQTGAEARRRAVTTVLSGPAAGVTAAAGLAGRTGHPDVITLDMGGTSTDVALLRDGACRATTESEVGGEPIRVPMLDISTIGAGGGSIAWHDDGGLLHVGPRSAGADPGPVCYGRGGFEPTVTDADLVLGFLDVDSFPGGRMRPDRGRAEAALAAFGRGLGLSAVEAARAVFELVNANMLRALRAVSVERGLDPRGFPLLAFGGAGPVHAAALAAELGCPTVVIPEDPSTFSALGLLVADLRRDAVRTRVLPMEPDSADAMGAIFAELTAQLAGELSAEGHDRTQAVFQRAVEARYVGQAYEIHVGLPEVAVTGDLVVATRKAFHAAHAERYGHSAPDEPVEAVGFRVTATVPTPQPPPPSPPAAGGASRPSRERVVWFDALRPTSTPVFERAELRPRMRVPGPALIVEMGSTTVVQPGQHASVGGFGELQIRIG